MIKNGDARPAINKHKCFQFGKALMKPPNTTIARP